MNLLNMTWPSKVQKDEWLGDRFSLNGLNTFKVMNGVFKDPLESSDNEEETETSLKRKSQLNRMIGVMGQPELGTRKSKVCVETHNHLLRNIVKAMNNQPHKKYFPSPQCSIPKNSNFEHNIENIIKEQEKYTNCRSKQWDQYVRARVNTVLANTFDHLQSHVTNTVVKRLPSTYKMVAQIILDKEEGMLAHKEHLLTVGSTTTIDTSSLHKIVKLSTEDPLLCSTHGISLAPSKFFDDMPQCRKLCFTHRVSVVLTESALNALLDLRETYIIPVMIYETDYGSLVSIENVLDNHKLNICEGVQKYYELLLVKSLCRITKSQKAGTKKRMEVESTESNDDLDKSNDAVIASASSLLAEDDSSDDDDTTGKLLIDDGNVDIRTQSKNNKNDADQALESSQHKLPKFRDSTEKDHPTQSKVNLNISKTCTCPSPSLKFDMWQLSSKSLVDDNKSPIDVIVRSEDYLSVDSYGGITPRVLLEKWASVGSTELKNAGCNSEHCLNPRSGLSAHVDVRNGKVLMFQLDQLEQEQKCIKKEKNVAGLYTVLKTLRQLKPGDYLLWHQPSHGESILLYSATCGTQSEEVSLQHLLSERRLVEEDQSVPRLNRDLLLPWQWKSGQVPSLFPVKKAMKKKGYIL